MTSCKDLCSSYSKGFGWGDSLLPVCDKLCPKYEETFSNASKCKDSKCVSELLTKPLNTNVEFPSNMTPLLLECKEYQEMGRQGFLLPPDQMMEMYLKCYDPMSNLTSQENPQENPQENAQENPQENAQESSTKSCPFAQLMMIATLIMLSN